MKLSSWPVSLLLGSLLLCVWVSETTAQRNWYRVISPDRDFTVEFPDEPEYVFRPNPENGYGTGVFRTIFGQYALEARYQEVTPAPKTEEEITKFLTMTKEWHREAWNRLGSRETRIADLPGGGYEADGLGQTRDGRPKYTRMRTYFRGSRVYVVSCISTSRSGLGGPVVDRFLDSFRFIKTSIGNTNKGRKGRVQR